MRHRRDHRHPQAGGRHLTSRAGHAASVFADAAAENNPLSVQGDPACLTRIFTQLLDKDAKNTPEGGEITLAAGIHDHAMAINVSDNGIGLTAETMPAIFDCPYRLSARASPGDAPDVGLATVRDLVEAQGGTLVARSAGRNLGSEFVVELPLVDTPPAS